MIVLLQVSECGKQGTELLRFECALMPHDNATWINDAEAPYCMMSLCSRQFLFGPVFDRGQFQG